MLRRTGLCRLESTLWTGKTLHDLAKNMQGFDEQMVICTGLIDLGMKKVIQNMSDVRLSKYTVFPPSEFASLVTFQLLQDVKGSTLDISETYLEYLKSLVSQPAELNTDC